MEIYKFGKYNISESYPGRLNKFYDEQISNNSNDNIFSVLFRHLNIWYVGYKVNVTPMEIVIMLNTNIIHTQLMEILSKLEKDMKKSGYHEPDVTISTPKNRFGSSNSQIHIKEI